MGQSGCHVLRFPVGIETSKVGVNLPDSLLQRFLKGSADGHDLTNRFHGRTDVPFDVLELRQIPLGDLGNNIVKSRLETSGGGFGDGVGEFGKSVTKGNLGGGVSKRVTSGLGGKGAIEGQQMYFTLGKYTHEDRLNLAFISITL